MNTKELFEIYEILKIKADLSNHQLFVFLYFYFSMFQHHGIKLCAFGTLTKVGFQIVFFCLFDIILKLEREAKEID